MSIQYEKNNKERIPFEHYKAVFAQLDPIEISERCNIPYDKGKQQFRLKMMDRDYSIQYPSAEITVKDGQPADDFAAKILIIRYLNEGRYFNPSGKLLTYRDIPWGEVYYPNFQGRCILRLSYAFGNQLDKFEKVMESIGAEKIDMGDCSYKFEFINNIYMYFILWSGDEDFPPSAQILFDDNFPFAFTAEDIAVVGDVSIGELKAISNTF